MHARVVVHESECNRIEKESRSNYTVERKRKNIKLLLTNTTDSKNKGEDRGGEGPKEEEQEEVITIRQIAWT